MDYPCYKFSETKNYYCWSNSVDIKPGGTWDSIHQKKNLSRRLSIDITICDHYNTTVSDSKGHKSWLPTQRWMQDKSPAIYG